MPIERPEQSPFRDAGLIVTGRFLVQEIVSSEGFRNLIPGLEQILSGRSLVEDSDLEAIFSALGTMPYLICRPNRITNLCFGPMIDIKRVGKDDNRVQHDPHDVGPWAKFTIDAEGIE